MEKKFTFKDISNYVNCLTSEKITETIVNNFIKRRKELKLTQKELAKKSGVSYASIRRFETSGKISLESLLKISRVIDCLSDFANLFTTPKITNLKERYEKQYK